MLDTVEEGAIVLLEVKYGLITLLKQQVDLCEQVKNVDIECPLEKGDLTLSKDVDLPKEIPPVRPLQVILSVKVTVTLHKLT